MALKHMKIVQRIDHVNQKIYYIYEDWKKISQNEDFLKTDPFKHLLITEEVIYFLRTVADEIISLSYLFFYKKKYKNDPRIIKISDIGKLLNALNKQNEDYKELTEIFFSFNEWLDSFNKIANAYKHSFINTDQNLIGRDEPCIPLLNIHHNNLDTGEDLYVLSLREFIENYNDFYTTACNYIKDCVKSS